MKRKDKESNHVLGLGVVADYGEGGRGSVLVVFFFTFWFCFGREKLWNKQEYAVFLSFWGLIHFLSYTLRMMLIVNSNRDV